MGLVSRVLEISLLTRGHTGHPNGGPLRTKLALVAIGVAVTATALTSAPASAAAANVFLGRRSVLFDKKVCGRGWSDGPARSRWPNRLGQVRGCSVVAGGFVFAAPRAAVERCGRSRCRGPRRGGRTGDPR